MGTTAKLPAEPLHRHHADDIRVFFTEQHHGTGMPRLGQWHQSSCHRRRCQRTVIDHRLNLREGLFADGVCVAEIKPQVVSIDLRPLLDGMRP